MNHRTMTTEEFFNEVEAAYNRLLNKSITDAQFIREIEQLISEVIHAGNNL